MVHQVIDGVCGRESVRFEQCAKMLTASQYGQLRQSLAQLAKESANGNFNKADVSVCKHTDREHKLYTLNIHAIIAFYTQLAHKIESTRVVTYILPVQ